MLANEESGKLVKFKACSISIHCDTVTLYFASSFTDSFTQGNMETHVRMILIMPLNAWVADFY